MMQLATMAGRLQVNGRQSFAFQPAADYAPIMDSVFHDLQSRCAIVFVSGMGLGWGTMEWVHDRRACLHER